jgi:hypothetical protein
MHCFYIRWSAGSHNREYLDDGGSHLFRLVNFSRGKAAGDPGDLILLAGPGYSFFYTGCHNEIGPHFNEQVSIPGMVDGAGTENQIGKFLLGPGAQSGKDFRCVFPPVGEFKYPDPTFIAGSDYLPADVRVIMMKEHEKRRMVDLLQDLCLAMVRHRVKYQE